MPPGLNLPRHRHRAGYATVVLGGSFVEASFAGRFIANPGDVLLHGRFDCHQNISLSRCGLQILRLPWHDDLREGQFHVRDADALAHLAEHDPLAAAHELVEQLQTAHSTSDKHWSERLAADIAADPGLSLDDWASSADLAPATLSRGFHRAFGVTPKLFRLETRTRRAWQEIVASPRSLTVLAHQFGFADLAHLSRSINAFTGSTPSLWRRSSTVSAVKSVQADQAHALIA